MKRKKIKATNRLQEEFGDFTNSDGYFSTAYVEWLENKLLAPLPPAEGAEEILANTTCCTIEEEADLDDPKNFYYQHEDVIAAMQKFAAQQQPTAEGAGHKEMSCYTCRYNPAMCTKTFDECAGKEYAAWQPQPTAEGEEQRIMVSNILQDFYRRGDYGLKDATEAILRVFPLQPTAEGAEEIEAELRGYARDIVRLHKPIMEVNPQLAMDSIGNDLVKMFNRLFATLHAQRIAGKMAEEKLREELFRFFEYEHAYTPKYLNSGHIINEYLKSREK